MSMSTDVLELETKQAPNKQGNVDASSVIIFIMKCEKLVPYVIDIFWMYDCKYDHFLSREKYIP